jgi:hypothetical protein
MKKRLTSILLLIGASFILMTGCKKQDNPNPGPPCGQSFTINESSKIAADVPAQWYALAITLSGTTPNQDAGPVISRAFGYMGLALYESVVPGMPAHQSVQRQLNGLPALPQIDCPQKILLSCKRKCGAGKYSASYVWQYIYSTKLHD